MGAVTSEKNERRKARLARVGERGDAERYHYDLAPAYREISRASAEGEPRCVREFGVFTSESKVAARKLRLKCRLLFFRHCANVRNTLGYQYARSVLMCKFEFLGRNMQLASEIIMVQDEHCQIGKVTELFGKSPLRAKFSSSGALLAKQRKRAPGRSQGPSPHPASSRDGDGAQNAAVLAFCGLREAHTRVRARAAYKVCVCVQYETSENVISESPPSAFPRFSCPEMNARPRAADSETRLRLIALDCV